MANRKLRNKPVCLCCLLRGSVTIWVTTWENLPSDICLMKPQISLIRGFVVRRNFVSLDIQKYAQWRFWSDCANVQADLNLCWAHMSIGYFQMQTLQPRSNCSKCLIRVCTVYHSPSILIHSTKKSNSLIHVHILALVLLNLDMPCLCKHYRSSEANWPGSALFIIQYVNYYQQAGLINLIGWHLEMGMAS